MKRRRRRLTFALFCIHFTLLTLVGKSSSAAVVDKHDHAPAPPPSSLPEREKSRRHVVASNVQNRDELDELLDGLPAPFDRELAAGARRGLPHATRTIKRPARTRPVTYKLHDDLLSGYRKGTRPVWHPNKSIHVSMSVFLYQIIKLDAVKNTISLSGSFELYWKDDFLQWDPRDYDGATEIFLSSSDVWIPEFSLYYSHHFNQAVKLWSNNDVRVNYTGHTRYYIPFSTESLCKLDVKFFPFDIQQCTLLFGSWAHSNDSISYSLYTPKLSLIDFYDNQEWELDMAHSSIRSDGFLYDYLDPPLFWEMIIMELVVVRMSFYYVFNLVIPSTIIALVAIIGFHTPGTSGKTRDAKFRLGIMTLMSMSVILLAIVEDMPKFSMSSSRQGRGSFSGIPLIGLYYFILLAIIGLSTVTTSMFVYLERHFRITGQIPCWLEWVACDSSCTRGGLFSWRNKTRTPRRVKADEQQEHLLLVNGHVAGAMGSSSSNNNNNNNNNSSEKTRSIAMSLLRVVPTTTTTGNGQRGSSPHCLRSTADVPLNSTTSLAGETNLNFEASPRRGRLRREISEYDNLVLYRFLDASVDELSDRLAHLGEVLRQVRLDITSLVPSTHADVEKRWQTIIRRLELASLFGYISMVSLTLFLFFHHDWYCSIGHNPCAQPNLKCSWMVATEAENAATCQQNSYN